MRYTTLLATFCLSISALPGLAEAADNAEKTAKKRLSAFVWGPLVEGVVPSVHRGSEIPLDALREMVPGLTVQGGGAQAGTVGVGDRRMDVSRKAVLVSFPVTRQDDFARAVRVLARERRPMKLNGKSAPNFGFQLTREVSTGIGHARPVGDLFDTSRDFTLTPLGERRYRYLPTATSDVHSMKLRSDEIRRPFKVYLLSKIKAAFGLRPRPARAK